MLVHAFNSSPWETGANESLEMAQQLGAQVVHIENQSLLPIIHV